MKWTQKGHEFDSMAEVICSSDNEYVIWGAGTKGKMFLKQYKDLIHIRAFIDSDPAKQHTQYMDLDILPFQEALEKHPQAKIIIATGYTEQVKAELLKRDFAERQDFFSHIQFSMVYSMYQFNKLYVERNDLQITGNCSLKCKDCIARIPYYKKKAHMSLDEVKENLRVYFQWVDRLTLLTIVGGDPMLHPQFDDILEYVGQTYYPDTIQNIEVYTNAVIMPSERTLNLFKEYHVVVHITDYSQNAPGKQDIPRFLELMERNGNEVEFIDYNKWYDIGFPDPNGITGEEELTNFFDKCAPICRGLFDKKLYFCSINAYYVQGELWDSDPNDYFDLTEYDPERRKELMEFNAGYTQSGYVTCCPYCKGNQNVNFNFIDIGVQL